jgi:hypothetical protein
MVPFSNGITNNVPPFGLIKGEREREREREKEKLNLKKSRRQRNAEKGTPRDRTRGARKNKKGTENFF